jgi:hypothetical protein
MAGIRFSGGEYKENDKKNISALEEMEQRANLFTSTIRSFFTPVKPIRLRVSFAAARRKRKIKEEEQK